MPNAPKYDPLRQELVRDGRPTIVMSFNDIDRLVGGLPATAYANRWWWGNEDRHIRQHAQCRAWIQAGYQATVSLSAKEVVFQRLKEEA